MTGNASASEGVLGLLSRWARPFLGEVVHGGMVPEDRAKRKARAETEPAASRVEPAVQSHKTRRSATPTRRMRPEAVQALAAVHAAEQRQDERSSEQQLEDHLRAAALARGQGVTSPIPLALSNAYVPLQRPSEHTTFHSDAAKLPFPPTRPGRANGPAVDEHVAKLQPFPDHGHEGHE